MDWSLFLCMMALVILGLVMVYSSSAETAYEALGSMDYFLTRQLISMVLGLLACFLLALIHPRALKQIVPALFWVSVVLLVLVLIPSLGRKVGGARRWLALGMFSFQPSEVARVTLVLMLGVYVADGVPGDRLFSKKLIGGLVLIALVVGLVAAAPDFGMAMLIFLTGCVVLFVAGIPLRSLVVLLVVSTPVIGYLVFSSGYRRARVMAYLNPWGDPLDQGYHTIQALNALGSGGLAGRGLGESYYKTGILPEPFTDSIVAVIGEELGYLGVLFLILLVAYLMVRGFVISLQSTDGFDRLVGVGLCTLIGLQALVNLAVVSALIPATGMTMPYVSYGGSSLIMNMAALGILMNISRRS